MRLHQVRSHHACTPLISALTEHQDLAQLRSSRSSVDSSQMVVDQSRGARKALDEVLVARQIHRMVFETQLISGSEPHELAVEAVFLTDTQQHRDALGLQPILVFGSCHGTQTEEREDGLGFAPALVGPLQGRILGDEVGVVDFGEELVRGVAQGGDGDVGNRIGVEGGWWDDDAGRSRHAVGVDVGLVRVREHGRLVAGHRGRLGGVFGGKEVLFGCLLRSKDAGAQRRMLQTESHRRYDAIQCRRCPLLS